MIALRWTAGTVAAVCLYVASTGARGWLLGIVLIVSVVAVLLSYTGASAPRPVSRHYTPKDH